jgi:hypothetical protein
MVEYLIIDPNLLYKLYSSENLEDYYSFNFLPEYTSVEVDIFYDILNSISKKELLNLNQYLYKQWIHTKRLLDKENTTPIKRRKKLMKLSYTNESVSTKHLFNKKIAKFINDDKIIGIYIMNKLLKFLYPC